MKLFYFLFVLINALGLGYMTFNEIKENEKLQNNIRSLEQVIDNQDKLLNNCGIY